MRVSVRRIEGWGHLDDLARLDALVRPDAPIASDPGWRPFVYRFLSGHPLSDRVHRWVLDAGGEVVGHLAALPQYYRVAGRRVVAHTPAEYVVHPEHGFHAIRLLRAFFSACENCVSEDDNPVVVRLQTRQGAEKAGKVRFVAKLWDVSGVLSFPAPVPGGVTRALNLGLQTVDRALNGVTLGKGLEAEVLEGFDEAFDELFEAVAAAVPCVPEKDAAFLRWRYGPGSPQQSATVLGVKDGEGGLLGYAVVWVAADGRNAYLLDLVTRPARHDVARVLLRAIALRLRRLRVGSVRHRFVESACSPRARDMWRLGYLPSRRRYSTLGVKFADVDLQEMADHIARWSYSYGDGQRSYWFR